MEREKDKVRGNKRPAGGREGRCVPCVCVCVCVCARHACVCVAATLISLNLSSLIRDLQRNPLLWEDICLTPALLSNRGRPLSGWGWLCRAKQDEEKVLVPFSSLDAQPKSTLSGKPSAMSLKESAPPMPPPPPHPRSELLFHYLIISISSKM